jgi:hypothetical protein
MKRCKSCQSVMLEETAHQSLPRIAKLLRSHGIDAQMVKQVARDSGPLCSKCLSHWTKDLSSN